MDITTLLAQLWGPIVFAIGAGIFVSPKSYTRIYRDLEKEKFALFVFGIFGMALGILHIGIHNIWDTIPQMAISALGWGLFVKSTVFIVVPHIADSGGDWTVDQKLLPLVGGFMLLAGVYLSWLGYLA